MVRTRISDLLGKITVLFVICIFSLPAQGKYGGGTGEPNDPYLIYTAEQMNEIGLIVNWDDLDKHFLLCADIDLSVFTGPSFNIIGIDYDIPFSGFFDGNGHTISNFTYTTTDADNIGLFRYVGGWEGNAEIKNLGLIDPNVEAGTGNNVGSLIGYNSGNITNCHVKGGSVSTVVSHIGELGNNVGSLAGFNKGNITNCYSEGGSVSGYMAVGGLVGGNYFDPMIAQYGTITNCYSSCETHSERGFHVGGLVGHNMSSTITNCYSTGEIHSEYGSFVGGLVGSNFAGIITNCYSSGMFSVDFAIVVGGLVGYNEAGGIMDSFWDVETSGQISSDGGIGLTTVEMQTASTFYAWACGDDFAWTIDEGVDYPRLAWENKPGELIIIPPGLYGGGSGEPDDPYLIYTAEQLNTIGLVQCHLDKHFKLMNDIDLSAYTGTEFNIIVRFSGTFDGNGHKISNLSYTSTDIDSVGLFGHVDDPNAEIKNLGLIDPNVDGGTGGGVGSLVGRLNNGTITACYAEEAGVSGHHWVGGLVGRNGGIISNCYSTASVTGNGWDAGGLVGQNDAIISNCYSTAGVSGNKYVGGLLGENCGKILDCYSEGVVSGTTNIGGLAGRNYYGIISNSYSTVSVSGKTDIGGLMGRNYGEVICSFWDIETSGQATSAGGTGLTTAEMQMQITFTNAGWDFDTPVWTIDDGNDYPRLWWEFVPVLHAEPEMTLGTSNTISWEPIVDDVEYYAECAGDENFTNIVYNSGWITETSYEFTGLVLGKRYWYSVKARNTSGIETAWSSVESSLQSSLSYVVETLLFPGSMKNKNMKNALLNKIDAVLEMIDEGLYKDALNKLQNDILKKIDGCAETGEPDKNDWIITCEKQSKIYPLVMETIEYVRNLMEQ